MTDHDLAYLRSHLLTSTVQRRTVTTASVRTGGADAPWWEVTKSATTYPYIYGVARYGDGGSCRVVRFATLADVCRHISMKEGTR